jgi:hypothetical protein
MRSNFVRIVALSTATVLVGPALGQATAFRFDPALLEVETVYHYVKSNIDGSRSGEIALYVATVDEVESFKWHAGGSEATLVKAWMDWESFTVRRFESWRLHASGDDVLRAVLERVEGAPELEIALGEQKVRVPIENWPWHSYDFDFGSLNLAFRFLENPEEPFTIGIADVSREQEGPPFRDMGTVRVEPQGVEERHGTTCRVYRIDGDGLQNRGGLIWVDAKAKHIVDYEIDLPDEPGFEDGKLLLRKIDRLDRDGWEAFKKSHLAGDD